VRPQEAFLLAEITTSQFWVSLLQIIGIDIILSGDNAVVIALACRSLPPQQQRWGIIIGAGAAIGLRIIFATIIVYLLAIPFLKLVGALLLFWIAIKLMLPEPETPAHGELQAKTNLWGAVYTIALADAVMSLDNVIGIAAAAKGSVFLIILGLLISIPLIVWGSTLILKLLHRFPSIVLLGGALLGYVAGDVGVSDPFLAHWITDNLPILHTLAPISGAIAVVLIGRYLARRTSAARQTAIAASDHSGACPYDEGTDSRRGVEKFRCRGA
jgi:YjbE family integral membrane protein